ncbi:MAG: PQQ-binding-like beta-propeller repeat protein [Candidatus Aenigmarchaeota archaeon]|nr:PQQ-binding-like beta-propeller repeat protein [Candidatus Aenigmarchaeota archaeon]
MAERAFDTAKFEESGAIFSRPVFKDDVAYFGGEDTYFYAVDTKTGQKRWEMKTDGIIFSRPVLHEDILYFGSFDHYIYAVSIKTKCLLWKLKLNGIVASSPVLFKDLLFVGSSDTYLYAISIKNKAIVWKFKTGDEIICDPVVLDGKIFFGSMDGYFYCVDVSGKLLWKFRTGDSIILGTPLVTKKFVCFGSADNNLYCMAPDGDLLWAVRTGDMVFNNASVYDNVVYFGSRDRHIYALDAKTGNVLWKSRTDIQIAASAPLKISNRIYIGADKLYCFSCNGQRIRVSELCDAIPSGPDYYKGNVFAGCDDGYFRCFSAEDGRLMWRFHTNSNKIISLVGVARPPLWNPDFFKEHDIMLGRPQALQPKEPYGVSENLLYGMGLGSVDVGSLPENKKYAEPSVGGVYKDMQGGGVAYIPGEKGKKKDKELDVFLHNLGLQG